VIPWKELDRAEIPGNEGIITLRQRGTEFSIRTADTELMNSRLHGSEDALAQLTYRRLKQKEGLRILIGGLGMGYTLAAALEQSEKDTLITVAELIPTVISWNRQHLGHLTGEPLNDPRVSIQEEDVVNAISRKKSAWDAILLDVDNGPDGLTQKANDRLYNISGLKTSFAALRPGGILAVWSSGPDEAFTRRLKQCQFQTETITVRAHKPGKGARHTIWFARKPRSSSKTAQG
jgi:spermidine synthase